MGLNDIAHCTNMRRTSVGASASSGLLLAICSLAAISSLARELHPRSTVVFPGALEGAVSCILDGNNVVSNVTSAAAAGDPWAYGISTIKLFSHRGRYNVRFDFVLTSWWGRQHPVNQTLSYGAAGRSGAWMAEVLGRWERRKMRCSSRFDPWGGYVGTESQKVSSHRSLMAGGVEPAKTREMPHSEVQPALRTEQSLVIKDGLHSHEHLLKQRHTSRASERRLVSFGPALHRRLALVVWAVHLQPSDPLLNFIKDIIADPTAYYVQVQTDKYPSGAARGNYKRGITDDMKGCLRTA